MNKSAKEEAEEIGIHLINACAVIDPCFDWDKQKIHLDRLIEDITEALEARESKGAAKEIKEMIRRCGDDYNAGLKKAVEKAKEKTLTEYERSNTSHMSCRNGGVNCTWCTSQHETAGKIIKLIQAEIKNESSCKID